LTLIYIGIMDGKLNAYRSKRDFGVTCEPEGGTISGHSRPIFVIHKHDARNLHYDLRLEVNGVLKSWAVPKGPSLDPGVKRLAVATEDHPLEYAYFEGVIPEGEYGAGAVIVWDKGTYINVTGKGKKCYDMSEAIAQGHAVVWLDGKKIRGGFALNRFRRGRQEQWLLIKLNDREANPNIDLLVSMPNSVLTGRTVEEVKLSDSM